MPEDIVAETGVTPPASEEELQAYLGIEEQVASGALTAEGLLEDIVSNPGQYPEAIRPHLASFLGRSGLGEAVEKHTEIFPKDPAQAYWEPPELARQALGKLFGEAQHVEDIKSPEQLSREETIALFEAGYACIGRRVPGSLSKDVDPEEYIELVQKHRQFRAAEEPNREYTPETMNPLIDPTERHYSPASYDEDAEKSTIAWAVMTADDDHNFSNEIAQVLINDQNVGTLLQSAHKFPGFPVDADFAHQLLAAGDTFSVSHYVSAFKGLSPDKELVKEIIRADGAYNFSQDIDLFPDVPVDDEIIQLILESKQAYALVRGKLAEKVSLDSRLFRQIVEAGQGQVFVDLGDFAKFTGLTPDDADWALQSLETPENDDNRNSSVLFAARVMDNPEAFGDHVTSHELVESLIKKGYGQSVLAAIDHLDGLTAQDGENIIASASRMDESKAGRMLSDLFILREHFAGLEFDAKFAKMFIDVGGHADLRSFGELDAAVLDSCLAKDRMIRPDDVLKNLDMFRGLRVDQLEKLSELAGFTVREFPFADTETGKFSRNLQYAWYADHAYQDMGKGWDKTTIGQIIALRLEQVSSENDLHDSSQWISAFNTPETGHDASAIATLLASGLTEEAALEASKVTYSDVDLERDLLYAMLTAPPELRGRLNMPSKDQKIDLMFTSDAHRLVYSVLLEGLRVSNLSSDWLETIVMGRLESFYETDVEALREESKDTRSRISLEDFRVECQQLLRMLEWRDTNMPVTRMVSVLQEYGHNRKAYATDAAQWLLRHATAPREKLVKAWGDRPLALAEGVTDSLNDILRWQNINAFRLTVANDTKEGSLPKGVTAEELLGPDWKDWRDEIARVQSARNTIEAIAKGKRWLKTLGNRPKVLPADRQTVVNAEDLGYRFEVLAANDPRGFTIGEDTACCMTINGASSSCIKEGYQNPNAGFMALYSPNGKLLAQSFMFVNPTRPDTVVLDNIEANRGRDFSKIIGLYKDAWLKYLREHPELGITKVNVGEGYTSVALDDLEKVKPVPPLRKNIYSDAGRQRRLLDLSATS